MILSWRPQEVTGNHKGEKVAWKRVRAIRQCSLYIAINYTGDFTPLVLIKLFRLWMHGYHFNSASRSFCLILIGLVINSYMCI